MVRWLKIFRAELVRDLTISLRYPVEVFFGLFIMYVLFMGLFMGAKTLAGNQALSGNLDGLVVGYCMWFFALMTINTMSLDIESEARQGTLEQVCLHASNFLGLLWVRAITHLSLGAGVVVVLSLLIQVTTGKYLQFTAGMVWPVIATVILTVAGLAGFGLILGGLSLVFKRIGQLSSAVQFSLFFLAYADLSHLNSPWQEIALSLPLARGVALLKELFETGGWTGSNAAELGWLLLNSLLYMAAGSALFMWMDRLARKTGTLSHY